MKNPVLKPAFVASAALVLFLLSMTFSLWQAGYWKGKPADKKIQKNASDRTRAELERLRKLLIELDHRGIEFKKRTEALDEREARLKKAESDLMLQKASLEQLTQHINALRKDLDKRLVVIDSAQEAGFAQMAKLYTKMAPQNAAKMMELLPEDQAVLILTKMKMAASVGILEAWISQGGELSSKASRVANLLRVSIPSIENTP